MKAASYKGFTLIEILIVVIILGILAAIVIPQFTNASDDARKSACASQLQTLRSAVELYKLQHADGYPTATGGAAGAWAWTSMMSPSIGGDGRTYGPYLQTIPQNPMNSNKTTVGSSGDFGWLVDANGRISAASGTAGTMPY